MQTPAFSPTISFYAELQKAYDQFNVALFDNKLSPCLLTLRSSSHAYGYHHAKRFVSPAGVFLDELGLHPGFFTLRPVEEVLSTLVHEMVHHWQEHFGSPTPSNAHNKEWGNKMREVGLIPSHTALPGGKTTGRSMSHYIDPTGRYIKACRDVVGSGFKIEWLDRHAPRPETYAAEHQEKLQQAGVAVELSEPPAKVLPVQPDGSSIVVPPAPKKEVTRVRYVCEKCNMKAWAAPDTPIVCGTCQEPLVTA